MFWTNPYYYTDGIPISEHDRQEITTHIYICHTQLGPCEEFVSVPYGEELYHGYLPQGYYYKAYVDLYGHISEWNTPTYNYFRGKGKNK